MAADYDKLASKILEVFAARKGGANRFLAESLAPGKTLREFIDDDLDRGELVKEIKEMVSAADTPSGKWMVARARLNFIAALHREIYAGSGNRLSSRRKYIAEQETRRVMLQSEMDTFTGVLESIG